MSEFLKAVGDLDFKEALRGKKTFLLALAEIALAAYLTKTGVLPAAVCALIVVDALGRIAQRLGVQKAEDAANGK